MHPTEGGQDATLTETAASPASNRRFVWMLAVVVGLLCILPFLYGLAATPAGARYIGYQYNLDDHMVYSAWARQAMNGHFLFDNRFAVDPQPSLTIHLYYWTVGIVAKLTGIAWAVAIDRFIFGALFVLLLARLLRELTCKPIIFRLALILGCFGAGIGFLSWQPIGRDFDPVVQSQYPSLIPSLINSFMGGHLSNDVWQPEGFAFSSLLTNSLFSVSLCLIVAAFYACVKAKDSWKPVPIGAVCMLVLMNIHSYDVLLIAMVLVGFLVCQIARRDLSAGWVLRVVVIGLGALPSALWFLYVLKHDPVFQSRAATLTYTESFRSMLGGYILLMLCTLAGAVSLAKTENSGKKPLIGIGLFVLLVIVMFASAGDGGGYWVGMGGWLATFLAGLVILYLAARPNPAMNLVISWAVIGIVAPFFPALFQRKLGMALGLPWSILAAFGLAFATRALKGSERRLVVALSTLLMCATSGYWLWREVQLIKENVSNTGVEAVYLTANEAQIIDYLNAHVDDKRTVVLAMPDPFRPALMTPIYPDLNAILSGLTGVYTYAGHWSETPDYDKRRAAASAFFQRMSEGDQKKLIAQLGVDYIVAPNAKSFNAKLAALSAKLEAAAHVQDVDGLGKVVVDGPEMQLIQISR